MRYQERTIGSVLVVKVLESRLCADSAVRFKEDLSGFVERGVGSIVLDLCEVSFIDSSGLGVLIAIRKGMPQPGAFALCGADGNVESMLKLTRMNKIFRMYPSAEEAAASLN